jgi:hypothetical protein
MNDPADLPPDEKFDEWLAPLRAVECPSDVRRANRQAIDSALSRYTQPPWWRRSVTVPMPMAVAASLALLVTAVAALWQAFGKSTDVAVGRAPHFAQAASKQELPGWSITQSYILSIETLARTQQPFRPDVTEYRNDI